MNKIKKFLSKKKVQTHFVKSGEGVRLSSNEGSSGPSITTGSAQGAQIDRVAAADIAAQAALKRMLKNEPQQDASKRRIQMIAKRELEEERLKMEGLSISEEHKRPTTEVKEFEHSSAITNVLYTSELLGEDVVEKKQDLLHKIEEFLSDQVDNAEEENDKMISATLMIYSLNKNDEKEAAITILGKYIQNILEHPGEEKYRTIKMANKVFQEKVATAIGAVQFLKSNGFVEQTVDENQCLVFSKNSDAHLIEALEILRNGQAVPIKVARNLEIFSMKEGQKIKNPKLGDDFFNLTADELKKEQKGREQQVERMFTLRTKEMRMKDEQLRNYRYKYTLIRVRLPGNLMVQGVFSCYEPFSAIRTFVSSILSDSVITLEYTLRDGANQLVEDESSTLAQLGLAPAALLHVDFARPLEDEHNIISDEYVHLVKTLDL